MAEYRYIYVFVRKDLPYSQVVVQSCHATLEATRKFVKDDARYKIICFGIRSLPKLEKVIQELVAHQIDYAVFSEPDLGWEKTAVATQPLNDVQRAVLARYKLLQEDDA